MDMKLSEFMEVYFEDKQNELKDRTMKNKRYMMEQHIIPYFGEQMLSEITASQIIQWQNEMQTKGYSESHYQKASPWPATLLSASGACLARIEAERRTTFFSLHSEKHSS